MKVMNSTEFKQFWVLDAKNRVQLNNADFFSFLFDNGFGVVMDGTQPTFVRIHNKKVSEVGITDIKRFVLDYPQIRNNQKITQYLINRTGLWNVSFLNALKPVCVDTIPDTADTSHFYYNNGIAVVSSHDIELKSYNDFKQNVWQSNIINRDYVSTDGNNAIFSDFVNKIAGNEADRLKSIIGYCLNRYRTPNNARAVIFEDDEQSGTANGGTGKSLLVDAMGQLRQSVMIDGKRFDPLKDFAWQRVTPQTNIILIDDVASSFRFDELFNVITGGISVNRKNKPEFYLSVSNGHTMILTTNEVVRGSGNSSQRRQIVFSVFKYFSADRTPVDEYGMLFFGDWTADEWAKFDNFMLGCAQMYHQHGIIKTNKVHDPRKQAIRETSRTFVEWIEENIYLFDGCLQPSVLRQNYIESTGTRMSLSDRKFRNWCDTYCRLMELQFESIHNGKQRSYIINKQQGAEIPF